MAGRWFRGPRRRGAHHPGSERPWVSRTVAISQHVPPSRYPGSITVIPSATAADLPNRQGPCLRNSSGGTPRPPDKRLFPVATSARKNWTLIPIRAATTPDQRALTTPVRGSTSSRPRGKGSDRWHQCFAAQWLRRSVPTPWNPGSMAFERPESGVSWRVPVDRARPYSRAAEGRYSTVTGRWSEAARVCSVSCTRCARRAGTSGPVTRTASMRRRTPCAP
jgi:hypothetical protein